MRPSRNNLHQPPPLRIRQKLIGQKYTKHRRALTHQSSQTQNTKIFQRMRSEPHRSNSSEHQHRYSSRSFQQTAASQVKNDAYRSCRLRGEDVRKLLQREQCRHVLSRSKGLGEGEGKTDAWGGPAISQPYKIKTSSRQKLQEDKKSVEKLNKLRQSINKSEYLKLSLVKPKLQPVSKSIKIELIKRPLPDYLQYINGEGSYSVGFDFKYLRQLSGEQAAGAVDFGHFRVIESIFLCIIDVLGGKVGVEEQGSYKLLREYSLLYFRMFEKVLGEFVMYYHSFKVSQHKILNFYIEARITLMIIYQTALEESTFEQKYKTPLQKMVSDINQAYKILFEGQQQLTKEKNYVGSTLKMLKVSSHFDKKAVHISSLLSKLVTLTSSNQRVGEFLKELSPLTSSIDLGGLELQFLAQTQCALCWKYFGIPPIPYLPPPSQPSKPYTLVLSLTSTLVNFNPHTRIIQFRPYLDSFLEQVAQLFQLVIWADEPKQVADLIVTAIEKKAKIFSFRLYAEHFSLKEGFLTRDLSRLGRESQKMLFLRPKPNSILETGVKKRSEKGIIQISNFTGDRMDKELLRVLTRVEWMTEGLPKDLSAKQPLHLNTLQHIEEELQQNATISTHN